MPVDEIPLPGEHSVSNVLAAVSVGLLFGIAPDAIRRAVAQFAGVEHRLELVAELDGVRYVNDSQGTQPAAVMAALRSFAPPIVLIAGGREKGVDITELAGVVAQRTAAVVLIGESAAGIPGGLRARRHAARRDRPDPRGRRGARRPPGTRGPSSRGPGRRRSREPADRWRPCCSAPPPRASTCSPTTRPGAVPSRPPWRPCRSEGAAHEEPAHRRPRAAHAATGRRGAQAHASPAAPRLARGS